MLAVDGRGLLGEGGRFPLMPVEPAKERGG